MLDLLYADWRAVHLPARKAIHAPVFPCRASAALDTSLAVLQTPARRCPALMASACAYCGLRAPIACVLLRRWLTSYTYTTALAAMTKYCILTAASCTEPKAERFGRVLLTGERQPVPRLQSVLPPANQANMDPLLRTYLCVRQV